MKNAQVCSRCVYDESVPSISFDEDGVCNYCKLHDVLDKSYPAGAEGRLILDGMAERIRRSGKGKYNCVVGVSGGCDSSYTLYYVKTVLGLNPLAVHFDNTWNSGVASQNIHSMCEKLGVDLWTYVADNAEYDDIYRAFIKSGLLDVEAPTDIAIITTMYMACEKFGIKYILEGSSFRTEGISPIGWLYMDGKFISSVHKAFGTLPMKTFPNLTLWRFIRWSAINGIRRFRPLWHIDYDKEEAKAFLAENFGWVWYGGHHLDNRFTSFDHRYIVRRRGGIDTRILGHAALTRVGQMDRNTALNELAIDQGCPDDLIRLVCKRLGFTESELEEIVSRPPPSWDTFPTYKRAFERLRPLFWVLMKLDRVPESFYFKFCRPAGTIPTK